MNYKYFLIIIYLFFLAGCEQYDLNKKTLNQDKQFKYKNSGFTLVYNKSINLKKITNKFDNRSFLIFHKSLKKDSLVKITNPSNQKTVIAKVIANNVKFSEFYNSIITSRVADELSLDLNEPYIDLVLISPNSTFIAKKAKTFEEERKIAEKAPVEGIEIDNLGEEKQINNETLNKDSFKYSIKIADFYYEDTAKSMINKIINETNTKNPMIIKLSKTKYRVLLGPFNDIKKLIKSFNEIKLLNFENLEILKNV